MSLLSASTLFLTVMAGWQDWWQIFQSSRQDFHPLLSQGSSGSNISQSFKALSDYQYAMGQVRAGDDLLPQKEKLQSFTDFCRQAWQVMRELVEAAHERQRQREKL